jgi:hypothetical protein
LGDGSFSNRNTPTKVTTENYAITDVFVGYEHTFMMRKGPKVFGVGRNDVMKFH